MTSSSIEYNDHIITARILNKSNYSAIISDAEWQISVTITGKSSSLSHTITDPYKYKADAWKKFLTGDTLTLENGNNKLNMYRYKNKYILERSPKSIEFPVAPITICLYDIIYKAEIVGYDFA